MYSSRRRYYRRNFRRNLFSPSYRTGISPTYTQMKGRVIRTTPLYDNPNQFPPVVSKEILDKMYKSLIDAKYPIPTPPLPPIPSYSSYTTLGNISLRFNTFQTGSYNFDVSAIQTLIDQNLNLHDAPSNTHWEFSLMGLNFIRTAYAGSDASRFQITWNSPILSQQYQDLVLVDKSTDLSSYNQNFSSDILVITSTEPNEAYLNYRISASQSVFQTTQIPVYTNDSDITNNSLYPLVTSDSSLEVYGSTVTLNITNNALPQFYYLKLYVLCYIVPN